MNSYKSFMPLFEIKTELSKDITKWANLRFCLVPVSLTPAE